MKMGDLFIREPPGDKSTSDVAPDGLAAVDVGQASTSHVKLSWHFPSLGVLFLAGVTLRSITIIPSTQHNFTHYLFIPFASQQWLPRRWTQERGLQTAKTILCASVSRHLSFHLIPVSDLLSMVYSIPSRRKASTTLCESGYGLSIWKAYVVPPSCPRIP